MTGKQEEKWADKLCSLCNKLVRVWTFLLICPHCDTETLEIK